jgi:hypothetical protein
MTDRVVSTTEGDDLTTYCEICNRPHVEVELDVGGDTLRMRSCSNCDRREWVGAEGVLDLAGVLDTVQERVGR